MLAPFSYGQVFGTPWGARQSPLCTGFSRQGCWSGLPFPPPGDLPDPGIRLVSFIGRLILYPVNHLVAQRVCTTVNNLVKHRFPCRCACLWHRLDVVLQGGWWGSGVEVARGWVPYATGCPLCPSVLLTQQVVDIHLTLLPERFIILSTAFSTAWWYNYDCYLLLIFPLSPFYEMKTSGINMWQRGHAFFLPLRLMDEQLGVNELLIVSVGGEFVAVSVSAEYSEVSLFFCFSLTLALLIPANTCLKCTQHGRNIFLFRSPWPPLTLL